MFRGCAILLGVVSLMFSGIGSYRVMADTTKLYVTYEGSNYGVLQSDLDGSNVTDLAGIRGTCIPIGIAMDNHTERCTWHVRRPGTMPVRT